MSFSPGNGIGIGKVLLAGAVATFAVAGLGIGLGIESTKKAGLDNDLNRIKREIGITDKITEDINITPPSGFIN